MYIENGLGRLEKKQKTKRPRLLVAVVIGRSFFFSLFPRKEQIYNAFAKKKKSFITKHLFKDYEYEDLDMSKLFSYIYT